MKIVNMPVLYALQDKLGVALSKYRVPEVSEAFEPRDTKIDISYESIPGSVKLVFFIEHTFKPNVNDTIVSIVKDVLTADGYEIGATKILKAPNRYMEYCEYSIVMPQDVTMFYKVTLMLKNAITEGAFNKIKVPGSFIKYSEIKDKLKTVFTKHGFEKVPVTHIVTGTKLTLVPDDFNKDLFKDLRNINVLTSDDKLINCLLDKYFKKRLKSLDEIRPIIKAVQEKYGYKRPSFTNLYYSGNTMLKYYILNNNTSDNRNMMLRDMETQLKAAGVDAEYNSGNSIVINNYTSENGARQHKLIVGY